MKQQAYTTEPLTPVRFCCVNSRRQEIRGVSRPSAIYAEALQIQLGDGFGSVLGAKHLTFDLSAVEAGAGRINLFYKQLWAGCCALAWADTQDAQDAWIWVHEMADLFQEQPIVFGDRPKDRLWLALYVAAPMQPLVPSSQPYFRAFLDTLPTALPEFAIANARPLGSM